MTAPYIAICRACAAQRAVVAKSVHAAWSELRALGWVAYWHAPTSAPAHVVCSSCDQHQRAALGDAPSTSTRVVA